MASITIKNLPEPLYKKLKARAKINNRSINGEIVNVLKRELEAGEFNVVEFMDRADKIRSRFNKAFSEEEIIAFKKEGRA